MPHQTVERQGARPEQLAPVLGATGDGRVSAESTRKLLVTVLGEFVLPHGPASTQTLIDAMQSVGARPKATRQALARLADRGWLERTREGRRTRWHLSDPSRTLLERGAERIYGFGQSQREWDGRWVVLVARVPDDGSVARWRVRDRLGWAGFASIGPGVWISPWTSQDGAAADVLHDLGVTGATSFVAEVGRLGDGRELAARAWDLAEIHGEYDDFLASVPGVSNPLPGGEGGVEAVGRLTLLVHRWRRFPFLDPELPSELLPDSWPASSVAVRFAETRGVLLEPATRWWLDTEATYR